MNDYKVTLTIRYNVLADDEIQARRAAARHLAHSISDYGLEYIMAVCASVVRKPESDVIER